MMKTSPGKVRIVGGKWRSRKISVPAVGVRPTTDAVRETLFNWLAPVIVGAECLDLFAGSGALSFEALSRGAAEVDMVDADKSIIEGLYRQAEILGATGVNLIQAKIPDGLRHLPPKQYDLVFIDAPFHHDLIRPCCAWLDQTQRFKPDAMVYIETEKDAKPLNLPAHWQLWRNKCAGKVNYCLYRIQPTS